ncbi:hypothetical protein P873_07670 [Arenimonas composti TR7-09 = DSM 18010]|uniref:DUF4398 domain-containing protein n=2 Tax=Arenimonas TaxID=490567 RepID=A0A091BF97_9GAMM|nr:hypothetical protein P873_07670 [Arenimonas composti TR7-09 = DSM 18010]
MLACAPAWAADPPRAEIAEAERAIAAAEREQPRGQAGRYLDDARRQLAEANALVERRKHRDALPVAQSAAATAELAAAQARLDNARETVDSRTARNADLRRRLLVQGN